MEENNLKKLVSQPYKYGFSTNIEKEKFPMGLDEEIIKLISEKKQEPQFMLDFRLKSYNRWKNMIKPEWALLSYSDIDYQNIVYYSVPKKKKKIKQS